MNNETLNPDELQKWCDNHPDYAAFKKECESRYQKEANARGISVEELKKLYSKGLGE